MLYSVNGREIFKDFPNLRPPKEFEWFLGFGLSHETESGQQITYRTGRICSILPNHKGRYLASSSIDAGDSGGPCYSTNRYLIGIMVSSTTTDPRLESVYDRKNVKNEIQDAASNPADTWITPSSLISEAHQVFPLIKFVIFTNYYLEIFGGARHSTSSGRDRAWTTKTKTPKKSVDNFSLNLLTLLHV